MNEKTVIIIAGPTASGKTALAIDLALRFNTSIISADSRQCFRELNIGVAKPSSEQLQQVTHFFINSHSLHDDVNASVFEQLSLGWVQSIFEGRDTVVMAGGTGLYIKAFSEGLDEMPPVGKEVRDKIKAQYDQLGLEWLQDQIRRLDPAFYSQGEILNPQRMMRALEIFWATGRSILSFRKGEKKVLPFRMIKIALDPPREILRRNIDWRVDHMMEEGLLDEVRSLLPHRNENALQTVGYQEVIQYFDGTTSLDEAVARIKINTWQYAKRQLTWQRKQEGFQWLDPSDAYTLEKIIKS